ncbi:hypothetical protein NDU88_006988 [Pleurodeles waltl]|uniref:Uncharacterized protein n=1 Tax=Pleurodeles waltl TaxID=8319 RepID=A0AAV7PN04_PLEWA|nr:hypothetical protein NDU88_006988 [Pleurodeles waltl]
MTEWLPFEDEEMGHGFEDALGPQLGAGLSEDRSKKWSKTECHRKLEEWYLQSAVNDPRHSSSSCLCNLTIQFVTQRKSKSLNVGEL